VDNSSNHPPSSQERALADPPFVRRKPSFWRSLKFALSGASYVLRTERNAQIEGVIALLVIGLGLILNITTVEWAIVFVLIGLVLAMEVLNTAVEAVVDLTTENYHDLAKVAKDAAAGAVLLTVISSIAVGIAIFGPRLWRLLSVVFSAV
jgi:diacylglycerol kinase (ATP)